jgi:geranylgeranyl diphosphate synthase type II
MDQLNLLKEEFEKLLLEYPFPKKPKALYEPISYTIGKGGKRMRPLLVLMGCKLYSDDVSDALHPALGIELFHNFTLIHDDIMDRAPIRRGQASVYKKWNDNVAILSGDAMMVKAFSELTITRPDAVPAILETFNVTALEVCEGQQYDMEFEERDDVTIPEYSEMIRLKTAVLLAACLKIGATIGRADDSQAQLMYDFGLNAGIAFQLQDDILDVYGESHKVGKQKGGDIISNKKTYLLLKAQELADEQQAQQLNNWLNGHHNDKEKVEAVTAIYEELNVRQLAEQEMWRHFNIGLEALDGVNGNPEWKSILNQFTTKLMHRES